MAAAMPIFIADAMLGRLATWLRLLGYDTAYDPQLPPVALLRRAFAERRVLLTRNRSLLRRRLIAPCQVVRYAPGMDAANAPSFAEPGFPLARCETCKRDVLASIDYDQAGNERCRCVHCGGVLDGRIHRARGKHLPDHGYRLLESAGCDSPDCRAAQCAARSNGDQ